MPGDDAPPPFGNDGAWSAGPAGPGPIPTPEPVWTYRGYSLRGSEFTTAMVHMFRAEVQRANNWRLRLDTTTNWAVVTTGAAISFAFTNASNIHMFLPLNIMLVTLFLWIEARRYRYYELWSYRVRLMETDFFAAMLVPPFHPAPDWAEALAENLLHPHFTISMWEAFGRRLRRNYLWIFVIIGLAWIAKLYMLPAPAGSLSVFFNRASVGVIPGEWVIGAGAIYYIFLLVVSIATLGLHESSGEVLPRFGSINESLRSALAEGGKTTDTLRAWFRPHARRQQMLTLIITDKSKEVSQRIFKDMGRGVTALPGTGMYTGQTHTVLMCALTVTEIPLLKAVVSAEDSNAFVIVSPAQEVFGKGFMPLQGEP